MILATPDASQIPWKRIKPLGSRWEVMNLLFPLHWSQSCFMDCQAARWETLLRRMNSTQGESPQSIWHLMFTSPWMQQLHKACLLLFFFLPTVVPSQLFGSYMQSWQLYTKNTSPLTAVTRSELKDPKSHLPTGTDRSHAVLPPPTRVHHSSHTKPFCKPASIPLHQSLRTAQADGLLLFPDSPITFLRTIRKLLH